jgi:hypothetical protein
MKLEGHRPREIEDMNEDELRDGIAALEGMLRQTQGDNDELAKVLGKPDRSTVHPRMTERVKTSTVEERGFAYTTKKANEEAIIAQRARLAAYQAALEKKLAKK